MTDTTKLILESSMGVELSQDEAAAIAGMMSVKQLGDGQFLISEGDADDSLHVLVAGKLEVVKSAGAGEFATLAILRTGDLAGELSFVDGTPHTAGLRALCDSQVLSLKRQDFEANLEQNPSLAYKVMRAVVRSAHRIIRNMNHDFIELSNYIFKQHGRY